MKIVGILSDTIDEEYDKALKAIRKYRANFFKNENIEIIVVSINDFDIKKGLFLRSKRLLDGIFSIMENPIMPRMLWIKTSKDREWYLNILSGKTHLFPSSLVVALANDKRNTFRYFKEVQPLTKLLGELNKTDEDIFGDKVVIKPRSGFGGKEVEKISFNGALKKSKLINAQKYIVQELCDFSGGVEGICNENHDIRLLYIGGHLQYASLRTNGGNFRVNVSQGGTSELLDLEKLPVDLITIAESCLEKLGGITSGVCALDFGYETVVKSRKMIEINATPGFVGSQLHDNLVGVNAAYNAYAEEFNRILMN